MSQYRHRVGSLSEAASEWSCPFACAKRKRVGFTYIEMIVVVLILLMMAALIVPNLAAHIESARFKELEGSIARLPAQAKEEAVLTQNPVSISIQGTQLIMNEQPIYVQGSGSDGTETTLENDAANYSTNTNGDVLSNNPIQLETVDLGTDITIASVQLNGQSTDVGSWSWTVYPDGSSDLGGIEFTEGSVTKSLELTDHGTSQWITGELPDESLVQWPAGQLETRSTTTSSSGS